MRLTPEGWINAKSCGESDSDILAKYKDVVKFLKMGKSLRDTVSRCNVSLGTVQKVKKLIYIKEVANC